MAVQRDIRGRWRYRKTLDLPGGRKERISGTPTLNTKMAAEIAEREHIQRLLSSPLTPSGQVKKEVPTFETFEAEFMATYCENNNKPSEIASKTSVLKINLGPFFGRSKLDAIQPREIESFKSAKLKAGLSPKTVNNHLTILRRILSLAAEWEIISHTPPIEWLKVPDPEFDFLDFEKAARLVKGGAGEWATMIALALGTGMRQGELLALRWEDVDLIAGRVMVRRAVARGIVGTPKSGKVREIPLNGTVMSALKAHRHLRGELVFCDADRREDAEEDRLQVAHLECLPQGRSPAHQLARPPAHLRLTPGDAGGGSEGGPGAPRSLHHRDDDALCAPESRCPEGLRVTGAPDSSVHVHGCANSEVRTAAGRAACREGGAWVVAGRNPVHRQLQL